MLVSASDICLLNSASVGRSFCCEALGFLSLILHSFFFASVAVVHWTFEGGSFQSAYGVDHPCTFFTIGSCIRVKWLSIVFLVRQSRQGVFLSKRGVLFDDFGKMASGFCAAFRCFEILELRFNASQECVCLVRGIGRLVLR